MIFDHNPKLNVLDPLLSDINNFVYKGQEGYFDLWYHPKKNKHYEEYRLYKFNLHDLNIYQQRNKTHHNFVHVIYVAIREERGYKNLRIFTQRIMFKFNQVKSLVFKEALKVLLAVLKGFMSYNLTFELIDISTKMICFNQQAQVKIWVNEDYYKNEKPIMNQEVKQYEVVKRIFRLIQSRISQSSQYQKYKERKDQEILKYSFASAISFIINISKQLGISLTQKIEIQNLKLDTQKVPTKLKFQKKKSLRKSNQHQMQPIFQQKIKENKQSTLELSTRWGLHRVQSVKYFSDLVESRKKSRSNYSQRLSFGSRSRTKSLSSSHKLSPPKSIIKNDYASLKSTTLKTSNSTSSEVKTIYNIRNQSPPTQNSKFNEYFQLPTKSLQNIKFVKQSIINPNYGWQEINNNVNLFEGLRFFTDTSDLKKSQYFHEGQLQNCNLSSLVKCNSLLFKSILDINIKQISENLEQQSQELF